MLHSLSPLTHPDLAAVRHGFFTRAGGASSGVFQGLNCGPGSSDQAEAVALNRARVAARMGVAPAALITLAQVHSPDVIALRAAPDGPLPAADALVSDCPDLAIAVLTADCQPVLLADPQAGVVGAAHAGWKGALSGVLEATVAAMARLGAVPERIAAVIGPTISQRAYEVGPEFMDAFLAEDRDYDRFFAGGQGDRVQFDLVSFGLSRLRQAGVGSAAWTGHCTYSDPARFFSYRRSVHLGEADYGRLIAAIRAAPPAPDAAPDSVPDSAADPAAPRP